MSVLTHLLAAGGAIPSFCTASGPVLEAVLARAAALGRPALIEATANQVNQQGGYTGMKPDAFAAWVRDMADSAGLERGMLMLGGDHLGPLPWRSEPEHMAMAKAEELVALFAAAGFQKLHLDTSMRLGDDDPTAPLPVEIVARRGARLARAALRAWREDMPPAFVIGSEVPIPGGALEAEDTLSPTGPQAFQATVDTYRRVFEAEGLAQAWPMVCAVVVQPGVEFSGEAVFEYDPRRAAPLIAALEGCPGLVFEGHSTDYQRVDSLKALVRDGVRILKVGPELTFALREALFGLCAMARATDPAAPDFHCALEQAMMASPGHWQGHYRGDAQQLRLQRQFSLSDRCRYYLADPGVQAAMLGLTAAIDRADLPFGLLRQHLPLAAAGLVPGQPLPPARTLIQRHLTAAAIDRYFEATR